VSTKRFFKKDMKIRRASNKEERQGERRERSRRD
jgi:hypothetical protein